MNDKTGDAAPTFPSRTPTIPPGSRATSTHDPWVEHRELRDQALSGRVGVKIGFTVAIDTAMFGALAATYSAAIPGARTVWAIFFGGIAALCLVVAIISAAMAVLPRTTGPSHSFIFFGPIAKQDASAYAAAFRGATVDDLLSDCLAQIHRNAEIATMKFQWVRMAMGYSLSAVPPWIGALMVLMSN